MSFDIRNLTSAFIAAPSNNRKVWTRQVRSLLLWTCFSSDTALSKPASPDKVAKVLGLLFHSAKMGQEPSQCLWENRSLTDLICNYRKDAPVYNKWHLLRHCTITFINQVSQHSNAQQYPMYCPFRFYSAPVWTPLVASHACGRVDTLHAIVTVAPLSQVELKWSSKRGSFSSGPWLGELLDQQLLSPVVHSIDLHRLNFLKAIRANWVHVTYSNTVNTRLLWYIVYNMLRKAHLFKKIRNPPCLQSAMQLSSAAPLSVVEVQRCSNKRNEAKSLIDWLDMWWKQNLNIYLFTWHHSLNLVLQRGHNQCLRRSLCAAPVACKRELANRRVLQPVQSGPRNL